MLNKVLFVFNIIMLLFLISISYYYAINGIKELVILLGFVIGAMVLNLGNFYGYIKNEKYIKKLQDAGIEI